MAAQSDDTKVGVESSDERTPLLLPPEDTLPIDSVSNVSDGDVEGGHDSVNDPIDKKNKGISASPTTVVLVLIVGTFILLQL
jgi:hypothetical protein